MEENRESSTIVLYVLGALLVGVGGAWLFLTNREPDALPPPVVEAVEESGTPENDASPFDALPAYDLATTLEMAELAMQAGQIFEPEDASALVFFDRVLALEPDHARAGEAVATILDEVERQGMRALQAEDYPRLAVLLDVLAFDHDDSAQFGRLLDAVSDAVDSKLAVVEGATRRGQFVPAAALLDEIATIPTADPLMIEERRAALSRAMSDPEGPADETVADATELADVSAAELAPTVADGEAAPNDAVAGAAAETGSGAEAESDPPPVALAVATVDVDADVEVAAPVTGSEPPDSSGDALPDATAEGTTDLAEDDEAQLAAAPAEPEDPLLPILAQAVDSLAQGRLVTPPNDNAHHYFREALRLDPDNAVATGGMRDVMQGLNRRAVEAARSKDWEQADRWLRQAESVDADPVFVRETRARVVDMRISAETEKLIPVSELTTRKIVRPRFPQRALRHEVAGWALLQFTVAPDGTTGNIEIVDTSERFGDQFARAAQNAVEKWQFEPREFMGQIIAARTQTKVTFDLAD